MRCTRSAVSSGAVTVDEATRFQTKTHGGHVEHPAVRAGSRPDSASLTNVCARTAYGPPVPRLLPAMALLVPLAIALIVAASSDDNEVSNPEQRLFLQALEEGREQYSDAPNEIAQDEV